MTSVPVLVLVICGPLIVTPFNFGILILSANSIARSFPDERQYKSCLVLTNLPAQIKVFFIRYFYLRSVMLSLINSHCNYHTKLLKLFSLASYVNSFVLIHIVRNPYGSTSVFNDLISPFFF